MVNEKIGETEMERKKRRAMEEEKARIALIRINAMMRHPSRGLKDAKYWEKHGGKVSHKKMRYGMFNNETIRSLG